MGCDSSVVKLSLLGPEFYIQTSKTNAVTYSLETDEIDSKSEISIGMLFWQLPVLKTILLINIKMNPRVSVLAQSSLRSLALPQDVENINKP